MFVLLFILYIVVANTTTHYALQYKTNKIVNKTYFIKPNVKKYKYLYVDVVSLLQKMYF